VNLGLTGMPGFWGPHPARRANAAIAKRMDLFKSSSKPFKMTRYDSTAAGERNVMERALVAPEEPQLQSTRIRRTARLPAGCRAGLQTRTNRPRYSLPAGPQLSAQDRV
jgi:hypothetical protein